MKPSVHLLCLIAVVAAIGLAPIELNWWIGVAGFVTGLAVFDIILYRINRPEITVAREATSQLSIYRANRIVLKLHNRSAYPWRLRAFDACPYEFRPESTDNYLKISPDHELAYQYSIRPVERGRFVLESASLVIRSLFQLWEFKRTIQVESVVNVYPDFATITKYLELSAVQRTMQAGIKKVARRGSGLEFEQLRDYRFGDAINQIDWNATSKHQKLISREFQDERDQMICVLMDSGMTMQMRDGDLTSFDHALNALILLSYVALRQGDSVLVQFFGHSNKRIDTLKGVNGINSLLNGIFEERSGPVPADYVQAAETLLQHQRRRSLVLLVTNTREKSEDIVDALRLLSGRHLTVLVNLRDRILDDIASRTVSTYESALLSSERSYFMEERAALQSACSRVCHETVDCTPINLLVHLLNAYLRVKRSGAL